MPLWEAGGGFLGPKVLRGIPPALPTSSAVGWINFYLISLPLLNCLNAK